MLERVGALFPTMLSKKIEEDVNEVLLCSRRAKEALAPPTLSRAAQGLQDRLRFEGRGGGPRSPHVDVSESLKDLKLL